MKAKRTLRLVKIFVRMFKCDEARVTRVGDTLFLMLGWKENTATQREKHPGIGQWNDGEKDIDFDYIRSEVVASGKTENELLAAARHYKKLLGMTMEEYLNSGLPLNL